MGNLCSSRSFLPSRQTEFNGPHVYGSVAVYKLNETPLGYENTKPYIIHKWLYQGKYRTLILFSAKFLSKSKVRSLPPRQTTLTTLCIYILQD